MNYDEKNWKLLTDYLKTPNRGNIHVINRAQLMVDVRAFHQLGLVSLYPVLNSIDGLRYETEYAVLKNGFDNVEWIFNKLTGTKYFSNFKVYAKIF